MDSPVRQYLKQKDYRRHKLFRKINRRRKAERLLAIDAPMKELRRRLKRYGGGKDEAQITEGQHPDMSWHKWWLENRADILGHNIKDTEIHPIWALQELTGYNFPGFKKIGNDRIQLELNNANLFREYTSPNKIPSDKFLFFRTGFPSDYTDQLVYDSTLGNSAGNTFPYRKIIFYHPFTVNLSDTHERTHALNPTAQEKKVRNIMLELYEDRKWFDKYYEDPSEIYARLMHFRQKARLNPKQQVTTEDLNKWRNDFDLNYGTYAPANYLLDRYDDETLLRLFNEVASNSVMQDKDLLVANKGKDSSIHIKPENRGKFTALKKRTGKSASWFKAHGTPALKKMATFALNARKWEHK